ncbi:hypothetical protein DRO59_10270, partial [Candidatus Bathyarchaeota archaeon]
MRILMVCPWHPLSVGGVQSHVRSISDEFIRRGYKVRVLYACNGASLDYKYDESYLYVDSYLPFDFILSPPRLSALEEIMLSFKPDVVHVHHAFSPISLFSLSIAYKLRIPTVLTNHTLVGSNPSSN